MPAADHRGQPDRGFDLVAYLGDAVREPPGDDVEFGFPRSADVGARPENPAVASFLAAGVPTGCTPACTAWALRRASGSRSRRPGRSAPGPCGRRSRSAGREHGGPRSTSTATARRASAASAKGSTRPDSGGAMRAFSRLAASPSTPAPLLGFLHRAGPLAGRLPATWSARCRSSCWARRRGGPRSSPAPRAGTTRKRCAGRQVAEVGGDPGSLVARGVWLMPIGDQMAAAWR